MSETTAHRETLAALAHVDGGWGYAPDQPAHLEPTCLSLLALAPEADRFRAAIDAGKAFLRGCAGADGFYRLPRGRAEAVWPTALVLFTQTVLGDDARSTTAALLNLRGLQTDLTKDQEAHDIDLKLVGWPWATGTFSWVEPTAWACLALRCAGHGDHPRVVEGLKLLLDRALPEGGVNYGNRNVLGRPLEPLPGPTALMLLALQGRHDEPRVVQAIEYVGGAALAGDDLEHLCWARLALDVHRDPRQHSEWLQQLGERIRSSYRQRTITPYVSAAPVREALTVLALALDDGNPFRIPSGVAAVTTPPVAVATPPRITLGERIRGAVDGLKVRAIEALRQPGPTSDVHVAPAADYGVDLADVVRRQYEHFRERVPLKDRRVVIKPNLVEYHRDKVINTNPLVVGAVIELCRREGAAEVIVAEGPGHCRNVEYLVAASGLGDVLKHYQVPFVDLNHDEPVKRLNLGRQTQLPHIYLSSTIATADVVISMPKLKTHHWAGATLSLKNLFGTLPGVCYGWPKNVLHWHGIDNSIVDIALTRTPDLAIVDGILGMEGDGPLNGTPVASGVLVMGTDLLAVDATCCRLMELEPTKIGYLILGARKKLGLLEADRITQVGETLADRARPYQTVQHFHHLRTSRSA